MPTYRQLEAFNAVMITGSVTDSAAMLGISQPSVSRMIADLEKSIGFQLFSRSGRQLIPTDEAQELFVDVSGTLTGLGRIKETAQMIRKHGIGQLRLVTYPGLIALVTESLILPFQNKWPDTPISLEVQTKPTILEWIVSQQCDFGISVDTVTDSNIKSTPWIQTNAVCITPKYHKLAKRKSVSLKDFAETNFISFKSDSSFRNLLDREFSKLRIKRRMLTEIRTSEAICHLVSQGAGISILETPFPAIAFKEKLSILSIKPQLDTHVSLLTSNHRPVSLAGNRLTEITKLAKSKQTWPL